MNLQNNKILKRFALGIKENTKILSVIGLVFFLSAACVVLKKPYNFKLDPSEILTPTKTKFFGQPIVIHAVFKSSQGFTVSQAFLQDENLFKK